MRRFVQYVCILIVVSVFLAIPAYAMENVEQRASHYFMAYSVYLWETSSTQFEVWFEVNAVGTMDELGASKIEVQRSTDQVNWTTTQTYEKADYSQMIDEDSAFHAECVPYTFTRGYYYRGVVTLYAKKGNGSATSTVVTATLNKR